MTTSPDTGAAPTISDTQLRAMIDQEVQQAIGYNSDKLSSARQKAEYYYLGLAKGDLAPSEVEGRSSVVSTDVADTIEWMLPSLLKIFAGSDDVVEFAPTNRDDEEAARQATDYVRHVFWRQNHGFNLLYTWFKDALLQKVGVLKVYWHNDKDETREDYVGLTDGELQMLLADQDVTPIAYTKRDDAQTGMATHEVTVKRSNKCGRVRIDAVPPEEFLIARRAKNIEEAPFVAHRVERTLSQLRAAGYQNVDAITGDDTSLSSSAERIERMSYDDSYAAMPRAQNSSPDKSQRVVVLTECYLQIDYDGDGIAEWRKIVKAGNAILENVPCDGPPFVSLTPVPLPHRFFGLSVADLAMEPQRIKTGILRAVLDGLYHSVNGRNYAVEGQVNLEDLMSSRPGGIVRVKTSDAVGALNEGRPDILSGLSLLDRVDMMKENRTGWTRDSQGANADALQQTATGINIVTNRADSRIELIARIFGETGVKDLFRMILKLVCKYQDQTAVIRLNNKWVDVDPRAWVNQFDFTVNVGIGAGNKDQQVQHLTTMLQVQREALQIGVATPDNVFNAASKLAQALGFKDPDAFFTRPNAPPPQAAPPPPDPLIVEAQLKHQLDMAKLQLEKMKLAAELTMEREQKAATIGLDNEMTMYNHYQPQSEALFNGTAFSPTTPDAGGEPSAAVGGAVEPPAAATGLHLPAQQPDAGLAHNP